MRRTLTVGLMLGSLTAAASAAPTPPPPVLVPVAVPDFAAPLDPAAKAAARRLAGILYSEKSQVAMAERMADGDLATAFRANPDLQFLDKEYPGFTDAILKELKPALVRFTLKELPAYHDRVAILIASRLNAAEIEDLTKFYLTPTGQKLLKGMQQNATLGATLGEIVTDPDKPTSFSAVAADHKASAEATKKLLDQNDHPALKEFAMKPYFTRVAMMGPAMRKLEQDFSNEPAPEFEAEIEAIMRATVAKFEAAKK